MKELAEKVNPNWYSITIIGILIIGILMLFYKDLTSSFKETILPGIVIYTMGTAIIGYIQGSNFRANFISDNYKERLWTYYVSHLIWFLLLIIYLIFYKRVL